MATLEELLAEHNAVFIGAELRELLARVVWATAPSYPPSEYSDSGAWESEALEDALHEWILIRLIERGDLAVMMTTARSIGTLRGMLTRSFSQFLINRRERTSASNLFKRLLNCLRTDERFVGLGPAIPPHAQLWTLASAPMLSASTVSVPELVTLAFELSDDDLKVVRYGPHSLKSSPILRAPQLPVFLEHLLAHADGALDMTTIADVARGRFTLLAAERQELGEILAEAGNSETAHVSDSELASSVRARLGVARCEVLTALASADGDIDAVVDQLSLPRPAVVEAVSETLGMIAEYADSEEESNRVFGLLIESLF